MTLTVNRCDCWSVTRSVAAVAVCFVAFPLLSVPALQKDRTSCSPGPHTLYSHNAVTLDPEIVRLTSPDRNKVLLARRVEDSRDPNGVHISYTVTMVGKNFRTRLLGFNGEVAWSPDSKAFAVTQTEGGGSLGSRVYVFYPESGGLTKLEVSRPIELDFGHPVKCDIPIPPNTGFISWGADSSTLLVAAEVVPVSICRCAGTYRVYEMKLPELKITHVYSQVEAKKKFWNLLGCELRDADDRCVETLERYYLHRK